MIAELLRPEEGKSEEAQRLDTEEGHFNGLRKTS